MCEIADSCFSSGKHLQKSSLNTCLEHTEPNYAISEQKVKLRGNRYFSNYDFSPNLKTRLLVPQDSSGSWEMRELGSGEGGWENWPLKLEEFWNQESGRSTQVVLGSGEHEILGSGRKNGLSHS